MIATIIEEPVKLTGGFTESAGDSASTDTTSPENQAPILSKLAQFSEAQTVSDENTPIENEGTLLYGSSTPKVVILGNLRHPALRLRAPLPLEVERESDSVAVCSAELEEFGSGAFFTAAIEDFQLSLVELYFTLRDRQSSLGPAMQELWGRLQELIEERQ